MQFFFHNDHLSGLLMDHRKYGYFISKSFYFSFNFDAVFSINWLPRELPVVCWRITSISYGFRDKLNQYSFKQNDHIYGLLMDQKKKIAILLQEGVEKGPKFWNFTCLDGIFGTRNSKTRQMSKRQWFQHIIVSSNFTVHIFILLYTCSTCPCWHSVVILCLHCVALNHLKWRVDILMFRKNYINWLQCEFILYSFCRNKKATGTLNKMTTREGTVNVKFV